MSCFVSVIMPLERLAILQEGVVLPLEEVVTLPEELEMSLEDVLSALLLPFFDLIIGL